MRAMRVTLCESCGHCPEVEISEGGVRIGESRNEVRLTHAEWNELVRKIVAGELGAADAEPPT